jgi:capsular exopolysaccharide synthesis family protein
MDSLKAPSNTPAPTPAPETKLHFLDYWRIIRVRKTVILAVFLLVVITATLVTFVLPESFSSTARIKVERDQSDISGMTGFDRQYTGYDPYFVQTEFEVIQSEVILTNVINQLDLRKEWGRKFAGGEELGLHETLGLIKARIDLRPVRNTSLIDIRVYSEKPDEAAKIANAIASSYEQHRLNERKRMSVGGIKALEERWQQHEEKIQKAQAAVDDLREELKIPDVVANENTPTVLMTAETLRRIEAMRIESHYEYVRQETILRRLKELMASTDAMSVAQALQTAAQDSLLGEHLAQFAAAQQSLVVAEKDYGPENPAVIKVQTQIEDLKRLIAGRVKGILDGIDTKVTALKEGLDKLEAEVQKAKDKDIQEARDTRPYFTAKRKLDELLRFGQILSMKIAGENIDLALPKTAMVEIIESAVPGLRPVRPNKPLNIALGVIIGLVVGVGLAFFIEYLDTSVKTIDDVERALQAPVLGVIPQNVGLMIEEGIESPHAEAYRVLRTNLLFSRKDEKLNTVAVVSAGAGEGKSTTVFNLAAVFAQSGQRVIVVDSDLRRPTLHKILHVTNSIGLTNYLLKQNTLEEVIQTSKLPTLDFMASGKLPSSSLGILSSSQMRELIRELKMRYDYVFFDSPPIMGVSDASILAAAVDMTLQVIQYRRYPQPMNIRAKQLIEKVGGNLIGIVLNNINMSQDESYYYYSGYYHDYYSHNSEVEPGPAADGGKAADGKAGDGKSGDKTKLEIKQKY